MRRLLRAVRVTAGILAGAILASDVKAGVDDVEIALSRLQPGVMDWTPAAGIVLAPDLPARLHLAPGRSLRLDASNGSDALGAIALWVGDGHGVRYLATPERRGNSLVLPAFASSKIVDVSLSGSASGEVELAVATGKAQRDARGYGYKRRIRLPLDEVSLSWKEPRSEDLRVITTGAFNPRVQAPQIERRAYFIARPGEPFAFVIEGPKRLRIETRLLPQQDAPLHRPYRIEWSQSGRPMHPLEFEGTWDRRRIYRDRTGAQWPVARRAFGYVDIGAGAQRVQFDVSRPMLIRMDALGGTLLSAKANAAGGLARAIEYASGPPSDAFADVALGMFGPGSALSGSAQVRPSEIEHRARRLARTNQFSNGAMVAAEIMADLAAQEPLTTNVSRAGDRLSQVYGHYRNLRPIGRGPHVVRSLGAEITGLLAPGEGEPEGPSLELPERFRSGAVVAASFFQLTGGRTLDYAVFDPTAAGTIRLLVDRQGLSEQVSLRLTTDTGTAIPIIIDPKDELPASAYARSADPDRTFPDQLGPGARAGEFGVLEVDLGSGVSRIFVSASGEVPEGFFLALQARDSKTSSLDPAGLAEEIRRLGAGRARALFHSGLKAAVACEGWLQNPTACSKVYAGRDGVAGAELYNDLTPLWRLARARERLVFGPVLGSSSPLEIARDGEIDPDAARAALEEADRLAAEGQSVAAVEAYGDALGLADAEAAADIVHRQLAQLEEAGEAFLAERLLRRLAFDCDRNAIDALARRYRGDRDIPRLLGVEVRRMVCFPDAADPSDVLRLLVRSGEADMALKLAAVFPEASAGIDLRMLAALARGAGQVAPGAQDLPDWIDADGLVVANQGTVPVAIPERGLTASWNRATPDGPLHLVPHRSGFIRTTLRPIHCGMVGPLDGRVIVSLSARTLTFPVIGNRPSDGLRDVTGACRIGLSETQVFPVRAGERIVVRPQGFEAVIDVAFSGKPSGSGSVAHGSDPAVAELMSLLERYRADPKGNMGSLPVAASLAAPWMSAGGSAGSRTTIWREFEALSEWERIALVSESAGSTSDTEIGTRFHSPRLRVRAAVSPDLDRSAHVLSDRQSLVLTSDRDAPGETRLAFSLAGVAGVLPATARILIEHPDGDAETIELSATRRSAERTLLFSRRDETATLLLEDGVPNAFVTVAIEELRGQEVVVRRPERELFYEVALAGEPVIYQPAGREVVRIDELRDGRLLTRYAVTDAPLILAPAEGQSRALYRLYKLVPSSRPVTQDGPVYADHAQDGLASARDRASVLDGAHGWNLGLPATAPLPSLELEPGAPGTWEVRATAWRRGRSEDETSRSTEQFIELAAAYRHHFAGLGLFSHTEILARIRGEGTETFGLRQSLVWPDRFRDTDFELNAALYAQDLGDRAYRLRVSALSRREIRFSDYVTAEAEAEVFYNFLSQGALSAGALPAYADRDVVSDYLRDHSKGAELRFQVDYRPYEDIRFYLRSALRTNEDFDIGTPDRVSVELGWDHQIGDLYYKAFVEQRYFPVDSDRSVSARQTRYGLVVRREWWRARGDRIALEGQVTRRSDSNDIAGRLMLRWSFGGGFEDHAPGTVAYRTLREQSRIDSIAGLRF